MSRRRTLPPGALNQNQRRSREAQERKDRYLAYLREGHKPRVAAEKTGVSPGTVQNWRAIDVDFRKSCDLVKAAQRMKGRDFDGTFVNFRKLYLGMETTWFQLKAAEVIEAAPAGSVTMILWPPGHGKTTLLEDWCTYKLVTMPSFRITVGSAQIGHSIKVLERVRNRLTSEGPTPNIHRDFGPFEPQEGRGTNHTWSAKKFNTLQKSASDERDYSMSAVGLTANVQGTRADLMLLDDVQSLTNYEQTDKYFDIIVQDFLSRPNMFGRTVIIGTRVGEFDVYRKLMDAEIVHPDRIVKFPAYNVARSATWSRPAKAPDPHDPTTMPPADVEWLWPEVYKPHAYAELRWRIGEQAWARNYMQHPEAATAMTFPESITTLMSDTTRGWTADPQALDGGNKVPVCLSLDPAIGGGNGTGAGAMRPDRLEVLEARLDYDLTSYGQIFDILDDMAWRYTTPTSYISEVVIEDKAFQRGLLQDDRLIEMQRRFGFRIVPNNTGREKVDPDIGIPAMPQSIIRGEITIPAATDESLEHMAALLGHLHQWRPGVNGVKLAQDMVIVLWQMWRRWRQHRDIPLHRAPQATQFHARPSPLRTRGFRPMAARR
jgi:hypothetical protein